MTYQQEIALKPWIIVILCSLIVLLISYLIRYISNKKEKVLFSDDGKSPGEMRTYNGIGFGLLGSFVRNCSDVVDRATYQKSKKHQQLEDKNNSSDFQYTEEEYAIALAAFHNRGDIEYYERCTSDPVFNERQRRIRGIIIDKIQNSLKNPSVRMVGYEFICFFVPLIPIGCYAYEVEFQSGRRTRFHIYGSQKWYLGEVMSIMLKGWAILGFVVSIIGIINIFAR